MAAAGVTAVCCLPRFFLRHPVGRTAAAAQFAGGRAGVRSVVEAQFEAFRDDDYSRARSYASAEIQRQFTTAAFERMVKGGYPGIAFWQKVSFGAVADNGHEAIIEVSVTSRRGHTRNFRYLLIREGELWRINGVVEFEPTATGQFV